MQRKDVERLEADLLRLAYECDEQGEGWEKDGPILRETAAALRALLAERDAAFAAGQEEMRERAVAAARKRKVEITDNYTGGWTTCAVRILDELQSLPIKPRP